MLRHFQYNDKEKNMFNIVDWVNARVEERTTWDGAMLIGFGLVMLMIPMDLFAYAAIIYGAWTCWKSE